MVYLPKARAACDGTLELPQTREVTVGTLLTHSVHVYSSDINRTDSQRWV